jgi:hypothetical protein
MDSHLMSVDRAAEIARDLAETAEELRNTPLRHDLLDRILEEQDRVLNYLQSVDPIEFWADHTDMLTLPGDQTEQQVFANRLRGMLYAGRKAQREGAVHTFQRIGGELLESLLGNMETYLRERQ